MLKDLYLSFERDARWTRNVGAAKPKIQKVRGLLRDTVHSIQMTVLTDSIRLVKVVRDTIRKNRTLVEKSRRIAEDDTRSRHLEQILKRSRPS